MVACVSLWASKICLFQPFCCNNLGSPWTLYDTTHAADPSFLSPWNEIPSLTGSPIGSGTHPLCTGPMPKLMFLIVFLEKSFCISDPGVLFHNSNQNYPLRKNGGKKSLKWDICFRPVGGLAQTWSRPAWFLILYDISVVTKIARLSRRYSRHEGGVRQVWGRPEEGLSKAQSR